MNAVSERLTRPLQPTSTAPPVLQVRYPSHAVAAAERQNVGRLGVRMKKAIAGFVGGSLVTATLTWLVVVPQVRASHRAVGENNGSIVARSEIADLVASNLGRDVESFERANRPVFVVKDRAVVVVERNGIKTLRVVE